MIALPLAALAGIVLLSFNCGLLFHAWWMAVATLDDDTPSQGDPE